MPRMTTCGGNPTQFDFDGSVLIGVTIHFENSPSVSVSTAFLSAICRQFSGAEILGGFSMTNPSPGGLGEWIQGNSAAINGTELTPRHGSFIAAILRDAGCLTVRLDGNTIYLSFP